MTVFCCDLDGVMWRGTDSIPGSGTAMRQIIDAGHRVLFVTNNSFSPFERIFERISHLLESDKFELVTSPVVAGHFLDSNFPTSTEVLVIGEEGLRQCLPETFREARGRNPNVVLVGLDRNLRYEDFAQAHQAIRGGATFLAANDDPLYPVENGDLPGAGALIAFLERSTGVKPTVLGKPNKAFVSYLTKELSVGENIIVIGDRLDQDGGLADALDAHFWLVLSGSTQRTHIQSVRLENTSVFENLNEAVTYSLERIIRG
jgi:HAD superfamily hydrolase (TIGR01450 family)